MSNSIRILFLIIAVGLPASGLIAISVGSTISAPEVRDSSDEPVTIQGFGQKVMAIFYSDSDAADINDPFGDRLKALKLPPVFEAVGVANLKDSWVPDSIIRWVVRRKERQYDIKIYTDPDHLLKKKWNFSRTNDTQVVVIVGVDGKVKWLSYGKIEGDDADKAVALIQKLIAQAGG